MANWQFLQRKRLAPRRRGDQVNGQEFIAVLTGGCAAEPFWPAEVLGRLRASRFLRLTSHACEDDSSTPAGRAACHEEKEKPGRRAPIRRTSKSAGLSERNRCDVAETGDAGACARLEGLPDPTDSQLVRPRPFRGLG